MEQGENSHVLSDATHLFPSIWVCVWVCWWIFWWGHEATVGITWGPLDQKSGLHSLLCLQLASCCKFPTKLLFRFHQKKKKKRNKFTDHLQWGDKSHTLRITSLKWRKPSFSCKMKTNTQGLSKCNDRPLAENYGNWYTCMQKSSHPLLCTLHCTAKYCTVTVQWLHFLLPSAAAAEPWPHVRLMNSSLSVIYVSDFSSCQPVFTALWTKVWKTYELLSG